MRVFVACLLLLFVLSYCSKNNNSLQQGVTYHKSGKNALPIRVFSNNGEIKDVATVARFTQLDDLEISRLSNYLGPLDTIQIIDGSKARIFEYGKFSDFTYAAVTNGFNFYSLDTLTLYSPGDVYTRTLSYYICLYKPAVYSENIVSSTAGYYLFQYKTQRQHFIENGNNQLVVPWMIFNHHFSIGSDSYSIQNKLDVNFYKTLQPRDTVVLREYSITYE